VAQVFGNNLVATVTDRFGNPVPNVAVTFRVVPHLGAGALFQASGTGVVKVFTDASGKAIAPLFANTKAGTYSVTASVAKVKTVAHFRLTNTADAATHFAITAPAEVNQGAPFALTVRALDQFGNLNTSYVGTIHFGTTDSPKGMPPDTIITKGRGVFVVSLGTVGIPSQANITVSSPNTPQVQDGGVLIDVLPDSAIIPANIGNGLQV
jgi:hypothetical protein